MKAKPNVDRTNPPMYLTRIEAAEVSTLGSRTISEAIARGHLKTVRIGDRRIVRLEDLRSFLDDKASSEPIQKPAYSKKRGRPKKQSITMASMDECAEGRAG